MQKLKLCSMLFTKQTGYYSAEDTMDTVDNSLDTELVKAIISYQKTEIEQFYHMGDLKLNARDRLH